MPSGNTPWDKGKRGILFSIMKIFQLNKSQNYPSTGPQHSVQHEAHQKPTSGSCWIQCGAGAVKSAKTGESFIGDKRGGCIH